MHEHTWYSVLKEVNCNITNVGVGMNQRYKHILALFVHLGYIINEKSKYTFITNKWDNLNSEFKMVGDLRVTSKRQKGGIRMMYICKNSPTHPGYIQ